jgi:thioredoxin reductase (NADPH)
MEEATYLTKFASSVTIVHRREEFRASKIMQERALNNPKISVMWNSEIVEMYGNPSERGLESVDIKNLLSGDISNQATDGVFMAIGHNPNSSIFKDQLDLNDAGYIITKADSTSTSVDGIFAAGDIQDFTYKQAVTAAGTGCMAAIEVERYLEGH